MSNISWHVELRVEPADSEAFEKLTAEMVEFARSESGVLIYERHKSEQDDCVIHVYERFQDAASALAHLHAFNARFGKRFGQIVRRKTFVVFGVPSEQLRMLLNEFDATFATLMNGFS